MITKEHRLGEIVDYYKGYAFNSSLYSSDGIMVVRVSDFTMDSISCENAVYIEPSDKYEKFRLHKNDILIQTVGSWANNPNSIVGKVVRVPETCSITYLNQNIVKIFPRDNSIDNDFLFYYLKATRFSEYCVIRGQGAANQASITLDTIFRFPVKLPPLPTQQKIASILSAYDNLIQNYKKQIEALQTGTCELYKEWFVRFRFPGYQTTKFENGIPEGWKLDVFSKYSTIMSGGTPSTEITEYYNGDIPFFTPKDWNEDFFSFRTIINITEEGLKHCNSQLYPKDTVIITARGTVGNIILLGVPMAMNQSCFALKSDVLNSPYYLFFVIKNEVLKLKKMANGGVFDTIIIKTFDHIHITIPDNYILNSFNKQIEPMMNRIYTLQQQITNLTQQRDLLLPRLMSGKIELCIK